MKIWLVGVDIRGCSNPECCGDSPQLRFEAFSNKEAAVAYNGGEPFSRKGIADYFEEIDVWNQWPPELQSVP